MAAIENTIVNLIMKGAMKGTMLKRGKEIKDGFEEMCDMFIGSDEEIRRKMINSPEGYDGCLASLQSYWEMLGKKEFYRIADNKGVRNNIDRYLQDALATSLYEKTEQRSKNLKERSKDYQDRKRLEEQLKKSAELSRICDVITGRGQEVTQKIENYPGGFEGCGKNLLEAWEILGEESFYGIVDKKGVRDNANNLLKSASQMRLEKMCELFIGTNEEVAQKMRDYSGGRVEKLVADLLTCRKVLGEKNFYYIVDNKGVRTDVDSMLALAI